VRILLRKFYSGGGRELDLKDFLENRNENAGEATLEEVSDLITGIFQLKVECIKIKKMISYCRRRLNRGLSIDTDHMQKDIDKEMKLHYLQLKEQLDAEHDDYERCLQNLTNTLEETLKNVKM
jgi:hypothetical protein